MTSPNQLSAAAVKSALAKLTEGAVLPVAYRVLEQRLAFDGAAAAVVAEVVDQPTAEAPAAAADGPHTGANGAHDLVEALRQAATSGLAPADGSQIVFTSALGGSKGLWIMNADGG